MVGGHRSACDAVLRAARVPGSRRRGRPAARRAPPAGWRGRDGRPPRSARRGASPPGGVGPSAPRRSRRRRGRRAAAAAFRIAAHARGARPASSRERRRASGGLRGKPETRNVSNSYPASGTSRASTRSGDPANVTLTPRSQSCRDRERRQRRARLFRRPRSGTATLWASAHRTAMLRRIPTDGSIDHEARAPVGDERERNPGQRGDAEHGGEVDGRLAADERGDARPRGACRTGPGSAAPP